MRHIIPMLLSCLLLLPYAAQAEETKMPFDGRPWNVSIGNLSVGYIQHSQIGSQFGNPYTDPIPSPDECRKLKSEGVVAYEDYVGWGAVQLEPGKWTWDRHDEVCRSLREGGLRYVIYPWLQFPPKWLRESGGVTLMRCAEHCEETDTVSIFDPRTIQYYDAFYREVAQHFGDRVDSIYACILGPYGEGNYPIPITWVVNMGHIHDGYWCADPYGLSAFRDAMREKYGTISSLNAAWNVNLTSFSEIHPPKEIPDGKAIAPSLFATEQDRRRWLDFITWYEKALADFSAKSIEAALRYFPASKVRTKPGGTSGGANPLPWGTYCPGFAKAAEDDSIVLQPADCHGAYFADKWCSTAYRHFGIRFATEPAGGLSRELFARRMFSDASCGASQLFTYEWDAHGSDVRKYIHLFTGKPGETDVAVYYPITLYHLGGNIGRSVNFGMALRDLSDYDVLDDLTIRDGALDRYRVFILFQGDWMEPEVLARLEAWVKRGGVLIYAGSGPVRSIAGDNRFQEALFDLTKQARKVGKGFTINCPEAKTFPELAPTLRAAIYHPRQTGLTGKGMPEISSDLDGVWITRRGDQLMLLNTTDASVAKTIKWRGKTHALTLDPHVIVEL